MPKGATLFVMAVMAMSGAAHAAAVDPLTSAVVGRGAFQQPLSILSADEREHFRKGEGVFRQAWLVPPSPETPRFAGLGPLFNRRSCVACHAANGRGEAARDETDVMRSTLVRLSVPGQDEHGGPRPEPTYGDQLQPEGVAGVPGEGEATFRWSDVPVSLAGGETVTLHRPELVIRALAYGPMAPDTMTSVRLSPPITGLGLLDAVPVAALEQLAKQEDGVHGRLNHVWDVQAGQTVAGRFGFKANRATLAEQSEAALLGDMGITSHMFPNENCTPAETACINAPRSKHQPEVADREVSELLVFVAGLAPPARRNTAAADVVRGERLFQSLGCAACHAPTLPIAGPLAEHGTRTIHPYTDLLIHDMGEGLADGRPDYEASGRDWRTTPLWGLGLTADVTLIPAYLHDGRARNVVEAILWHGGEAQKARDAFAAQPKSTRDALLAFLNSL